RTTARYLLRRHRRDRARPVGLGGCRARNQAATADSRHAPAEQHALEPIPVRRLSALVGGRVAGASLRPASVTRPRRRTLGRRRPALPASVGRAPGLSSGLPGLAAG